MEDALVVEIKTLVAIYDSKRGAIGLIYRKFPVSLQRICIHHYLSPKSYKDSSWFLAM